MKSGYPPIIIRAENKLTYYNALDKAHIIKETSDFVELIKIEVERTLDLYLNVV